MEIRHALHPSQAKQFDTCELRRSFLVEDLFLPDKCRLVYSYYDRLIIGGLQPEPTLGLEVDEGLIGSKYLLERREMGIINVGSPGSITVDGREYPLGARDALYVGKGAKELGFASASKDAPARFYLLCAPAHQNHPTRLVSLEESAPVHLGTDERSNRRTIYKYIHPDGVKSCQLVMGLTILEPKNVWNTMPTHTHVRRVEAYLYLDLPEGDMVVHFMGEPSETRHLVVRNGEAVLSPSWSIHSGVGTTNYSFVWAMAGENQTFTDMDDVPMSILR